MKTKLSVTMTTLAAFSLLFGMCISDVQAKSKSSHGHGGGSRSKSHSSNHRSHSSKSHSNHQSRQNYSHRSNHNNGHFNGHRSNHQNNQSNGHHNKQSNGHYGGQKKHNSHNNNHHNGHGQKWNGHYNHGQHGHQRHNWNSWWYSYYTPLRNYGSRNYRYCDWNYVNSDYTSSNGVIVQDVRWFLGLRGLVLPGKGIGIEQIEANSPASLAGLQQGMVITRVNGIDMVDDATMSQVIKNSGGTLVMDVLDKLDGGVFSVTVSMRQLAVSSF